MGTVGIQYLRQKALFDIFWTRMKRNSVAFHERSEKLPENRFLTELLDTEGHRKCRRYRSDIASRWIWCPYAVILFV